MARLLKFFTYISEDVTVKDAIGVSKADTSQEYDEDEIVDNIKILTAALEDVDNKDSKLDKAAKKDFMNKLRGWVSLYKDRYEPDDDLISSAEKYISAVKPKKNTAPIDPAASALDISIAAKTGAMAPDPEVIKMLDKKEKEEKDKAKAARK